MYDNICALSLFLTRGPYAPPLAKAGEKSPECLILLNKRVEAACQGLYGRCQSLFFLLFSRPSFWLQPPARPPVNKPDARRKQEVPRVRLSHLCSLNQSRTVSSYTLPGVDVSRRVAVCVIPDNEHRPQNLCQTLNARSENIALPADGFVFLQIISSRNEQHLKNEILIPRHTTAVCVTDSYPYRIFR